MTIDELKEQAARMLTFGIEKIRRTGDLHQMFHLVRHDGSIEVYLIDGTITDEEDAKRALSVRLQTRVAQGDIEAVIHLSDTFWTQTTPEKNKIRLALGLTLEEAGKAGLCTVHEGVTCFLESPILHQIARQEYRRDGARVELVGTPDVKSDEDGRLSKMFGRFHFFRAGAARA